MGFGARVIDAVRRAGTPLVLGIDPRTAEIPPGLDLRAFSLALVDLAAEERLPAIKPQVAFYEAAGPDGLAAFAETLARARAAGLLTIADVKRGDIGSTAEAYAAAYFGPTAPFRADSITASPYLGGDSLDPLIRAASADNAGVFVLVRTSNPGAADLQERPLAGGGLLLDRTAALVASRAEATRDDSGYGAVGAVVGATAPGAAARLRDALRASVLLAPGVGAQGASPAALRPFFDARGHGALVPVARAISGAWRDEPGTPWREACRAAIRRLRDELAAALPR